MQETAKADIRVHGSCGCGTNFRAEEADALRPRVQLAQILEAAIRHAEQTGHTLDVLGVIRMVKTPTVVLPNKWKRERVNGKE